MRHFLLVPILYILSIPAFPAETIHVPTDRPTIQSAIDAASNGDTVLVAPSVYAENIDFKGKSILVKSEDGPMSTTLFGLFPSDPDFASVVTFASGEGPDAVLDGFTLIGGTGTNGKSWGIEAFCGGGILCMNESSPSIKNTVIRENHIDGRGAGMFVHYSSPELFDCVFFGNSSRSSGSWSWGGGLYFEGDSSLKKGSPTLTRCAFIENMTEGYQDSAGGGMYNRFGSPTLIDCIFYKNNRRYEHGGIVHGGGGGLFNNAGHMRLIGCIFEKNASETRNGGGIYNAYGSLEITNCMFKGNSAGTVASNYHHGGGIYNNSGVLELTNCSFSSNFARYGGALSNNYGQTALTNCILWGNEQHEIFNFGMTVPTASYSCIQGGYAGTGNIDVDPLFVDQWGMDLHLTYPSPCRDTGDGSAVTESIDFEGDPRIAHGEIDMGADEFATHLYCSGSFTHGGMVKANFVGMPGTSPVGLFIGSGILEKPLHYPWGLFYLESPWLLVPLMPLPSNGVQVVPAIVPTVPPVPFDLPLQAIIGNELSNLFVLEIR